MSKSVLVIDTPENCYYCPFGSAYCSGIEYVAYCELADCLDYDAFLMTEEHYDRESKSRPEWCPLMDLPEKDNGGYPSNTFDAGFAEGWRNGLMACAKKCDRCGKLYEQYNSKNDRKNPNGIMVLNLDSQRRYFTHNALDLCPDCMKEFQDWMKEVK